jgi:hypothetical protein
MYQTSPKNTNSPINNRDTTISSVFLSKDIRVIIATMQNPIISMTNIVMTIYIPSNLRYIEIQIINSIENSLLTKITPASY